MRFLPQAIRIIEINLDEKKVLDLLEEEFGAMNSQLDWQEDFEDELFFQRGEGLFRIDANIKGGKSGTLDLVCIGSLEKADGKTRLTLDYAIHNYFVEWFFKILLGSVALISLLLLIAFFMSGFKIDILQLLWPIPVFVFITWIIRSGYTDGIINLHNKIYWTLNTTLSRSA